MTPMANRAYEIADEYRRRGVKVVLGGMHASVLPEEAICHADAVVIGEAEHVWHQVLEDFKANSLKRFYTSDEVADLKNLPFPRTDLLKGKMFFPLSPIQTTRGCPFSCDFCSVSKFFGYSFRFRPVREVIREIEAANKRVWFFCDDNITGNLLYAKKLFRELAPLNIKWVGQSSLLVAGSDELLRLAAESGCIGLFIGFESLSSLSLQSVNKKFNEVEHYEEAIRKLHDKGILIQGSFIFGLDHDDKYIFEKTVEFFNKNRIAFSSFCILTPFPGTRLYERLEKEGRIITHDWSKYDLTSVVFHPRLMSQEELFEGVLWTRKEVHSFASILARFPANWNHPLIYSVINLSYHTRCKKERKKERKSSSEIKHEI